MAGVCIKQHSLPGNYWFLSLVMAMGMTRLGQSKVAVWPLLVQNCAYFQWFPCLRRAASETWQECGDLGTWASGDLGIW